jgi:hypothetical protein
MRLKHVRIPLVAFALSEASAAPSPWKETHRIAISSDGNPNADADDIGATPFTLAVLAKAGLQNQLVHYDFNNFLEYKKIEAANNDMWMGAIGGQTRWGFDRKRFFDGSVDPRGAVKNLASEINRSTADDPLYLIIAGPLELTYRALEIAEPEARKHVVLVSHHNYNEYFTPRLWQRNITDIRNLVPDIGYIKIKDQNGHNGSGLKGAGNQDFEWLRDHADENLNWVFERISAGKPDVSDTGMITWLIGINGEDEVVTIPEMKAWFGADKIPTKGTSAAAPAPPAGTLPDVRPPAPTRIFTETDGRLVIEAENVTLTDHWIFDNTEEGYSSEGYIRWMPSYIHEISHQHQGTLAYRIRITNPGTYRMAMRSSHKGAPERDKWNDCWTLMGLNPVHPYGITRKTYHAINNEEYKSGMGFSWHTTHNNYGSVAKTDGEFSVPTYELEAGDHYFWICGRSGGFRIDKIHLFKNDAEGFKDDSIPTSPIIETANTYSGVADFTLQPAEDGRTEYYVAPQNGKVLGINAAKPDTHGKFARAKFAYNLGTGHYDVTIKTITEFDGESTYRLLVNDDVVATFQNPRVGTDKDLKEHAHTWKKIYIKQGDTVSIESNADSNGLIPEGDAHAWARGRWKNLSFVPTGD